MKYVITGWASNGTPVSRLVEFPDEAAVRAYANSVGVTLSKIEVAPENLQNARPYNADRTGGEKLREFAFVLFIFASVCFSFSVMLLLAANSSPFPLVIATHYLLPLVLFLFLLAALYHIGGAIVRAIERQ